MRAPGRQCFLGLDDHRVRHQGASEGNEKLVWILIIVFTHWIGAAIDYFAEKISAAKQRQIAAHSLP